MALVQVLLRSDRSTLNVAELVSQCHALFRGIFDPYRPEQHYMRGPGPKWREKNGRTA